MNSQLFKRRLAPFSRTVCVLRWADPMDMLCCSPVPGLITVPLVAVEGLTR